MMHLPVESLYINILVGGSTVVSVLRDDNYIYVIFPPIKPSTSHLSTILYPKERSDCEQNNSPPLYQYIEIPPSS